MRAGAGVIERSGLSAAQGCASAAGAGCARAAAPDEKAIRAELDRALDASHAVLSQGAIALDQHGNIAMPFNTSGMCRGWIKPLLDPSQDCHPDAGLAFSELHDLREQRLAHVHASLRVVQTREHRKRAIRNSNRGHP